MIDDYKRIKNGKPENVRWHYRNVNTKTKLEKAVENEIRLGKAKKLLGETDKYWVECLEDDNIRIPLWFFKFKFKWNAYRFREENNRFPNNKERILISLKEGGTYYNTKELAEDTGIDYKNISRYIKELEKEREIKIRPMQNNQKAIYLAPVYKDYKKMGIIKE